MGEGVQRGARGSKERLAGEEETSASSLHARDGSPQMIPEHLVHTLSPNSSMLNLKLNTSGENFKHIQNFENNMMNAMYPSPSVSVKINKLNRTTRTCVYLNIHVCMFACMYAVVPL